jgi:hypothetical protein
MSEARMLTLLDAGEVDVGRRRHICQAAAQ